MTNHIALHHALVIDTEHLAGRGTRCIGTMVETQIQHDVTIMLVDDEPAVRNVLARALRREGYSIIDAQDGIEAIDMLADGLSSPVHLLITDLNMPRLGGLDLARRVRDANWVRRVIFMTGDVTLDTLSDGDESALLWKPFNLQSLVGTVRDMLAR